MAIKIEDGKKYSSIANYAEGNYKTEFLVQEKLDGCNIQIEFTKNGVINVYSRKFLLDNEEDKDKLFELGRFLASDETITSFMKYYKSYAISTQQDVRFAGEFFGNHVQKRIKYNHEGGRYLIFDVYIDDKKLAPIQFLGFMCNGKFKELMVHFYTLKENHIEDVIPQLDPEFKSQYSDDKAEGFVIKSSYLVVKYKRDDFNERGRTFGEKKPREKKENPFKKYDEYINANRILSANSKLGTFDKTKIGELVVEVLNDISQEIEVDFENEKAVKYIKGKAGAAAMLLHKQNRI